MAVSVAVFFCVTSVSANAQKSFMIFYANDTVSEFGFPEGAKSGFPHISGYYDADFSQPGGGPENWGFYSSWAGDGPDTHRFFETELVAAESRLSLAIAETETPHEGTGPLCADLRTELVLDVGTRYFNDFINTRVGLELVLVAATPLTVSVSSNIIRSDYYAPYPISPAGPIDPSVVLFTSPSLPFPAQSGQCAVPVGLHKVKFSMPANFGLSNGGAGGQIRITIEAAPSALADFDEDGFADQLENLASYDPLDVLDFPGAPPVRITLDGFSRVPDGSAISWSINRNRRPVRIERITDLASDGWQTVLTTTNGRSFFDTSAVGSRAFYRLVTP